MRSVDLDYYSKELWKQWKKDNTTVIKLLPKTSCDELKRAFIDGVLAGWKLCVDKQDDSTSI